VFLPNRAISIALILGCIADAMFALFAWVLSQFTSLTTLTDTTTPRGHIYAGIQWAQLILGAVLILLFLIWIHRVCKNSWLLDPPKMKTTPGLAVAYFFIPVLALWKPLTTITELRNASYGRSDRLVKTLPLWWLFCLVLMFIGYFHLIAQTPGTEKETLSIARKLNTVALPLRIIVDYLTLSIVLGITDAQKKRALAWKP